MVSCSEQDRVTARRPLDKNRAFLPSQQETNAWFAGVEFLSNVGLLAEARRQRGLCHGRMTRDHLAKMSAALAPQRRSDEREGSCSSPPCQRLARPHAEGTSPALLQKGGAHFGLTTSGLKCAFSPSRRPVNSQSHSQAESINFGEKDGCA